MIEGPLSHNVRSEVNRNPSDSRRRPASSPFEQPAWQDLPAAVHSSARFSSDGRPSRADGRAAAPSVCAARCQRFGGETGVDCSVGKRPTRDKDGYHHLGNLVESRH